MSNLAAAITATDATEKGGDDFEDRDSDRPNPATSPGVTAGADAAQAREAALKEAAAVCEYIIKNIEILKADGETYETPRVQKIARGLVDLARQDILALIGGAE